MNITIPGSIPGIPKNKGEGRHFGIKYQKKTKYERIKRCKKKNSFLVIISNQKEY